MGKHSKKEKPQTKKQKLSGKGKHRLKTWPDEVDSLREERRKNA